MSVSRLQRKELNRLQTHHKVSAYSPDAVLIVSVRIRHLVGGRRPMVIPQNAEGSWAFMGIADTEKQTHRMERQCGTHKHRGLTLSAQHIRRR